MHVYTLYPCDQTLQFNPPPDSPHAPPPLRLCTHAQLHELQDDAWKLQVFGELEALKRQLAALNALEADLDAAEAVLDADEAVQGRAGAWW